MMKQIVYVLGVTGSMALVLGVFLKIQQWAGANIIITFASLVLLLFIPLLAVYLYRKNSE